LPLDGNEKVARREPPEPGIGQATVFERSGDKLGMAGWRVSQGGSQSHQRLKAVPDSSAGSQTESPPLSDLPSCAP